MGVILVTSNPEVVADVPVGRDHERHRGHVHGCTCSDAITFRQARSTSAAAEGLARHPMLTCTVRSNRTYHSTVEPSPGRWR
jgi:hypothetical protein